MEDAFLFSLKSQNVAILAFDELDCGFPPDQYHTNGFSLSFSRGKCNYTHFNYIRVISLTAEKIIFTCVARVPIH